MLERLFHLRENAMNKPEILTKAHPYQRKVTASLFAPTEI
jgi:hypothetical protein